MAQEQSSDVPKSSADAREQQSASSDGNLVSVVAAPALTVAFLSALLAQLPERPMEVQLQVDLRSVALFIAAVVALWARSTLPAKTVTSVCAEAQRCLACS
ncbi:unnamed protein product [Polarella glacialis]|uniref:Uncharacterized protein n=1 Tax=Polarella glacialis TaxID=89957 RepID=A0A813DFL9_POLGL|nr:unnamed protein product [Polarella glacialis]